MQPTATRPAEDQEFPYGWRYVQKGEVTIRVPLTLDDCLYPQEGDVLLENSDHDEDLVYLASVCRSRPLSPAVAIVTRDMGVNWGHPGIGNHSPGIGVFVGLSHDPRPTGLLELKALNGRCELIIEAVSPKTRKNDVVDKVSHYHQVGVPLYIIIDQERPGGPRFLRPFRWTPTGYKEIPLDARAEST